MTSVRASVVAHGFGTLIPGAGRIVSWLRASWPDRREGSPSTQASRIYREASTPALANHHCPEAPGGAGRPRATASPADSAESARWLRPLTLAPGQRLVQPCTGNDFQMTNISLVVSKCRSRSQVIIMESRHTVGHCGCVCLSPPFPEGGSWSPVGLQ